MALLAGVVQPVLGQLVNSSAAQRDAECTAPVRAAAYAKEIYPRFTAPEFASLRASMGVKDQASAASFRILADERQCQALWKLVSALQDTSPGELKKAFELTYFSLGRYVAVFVVRRPNPDYRVYGNSPLFVFDREKLTFKGELQF